MLEATKLSALNGVRHGFFTRKGGVSDDTVGDMNGLNCGYGADDSPENVARNRDIAMRQLGRSGEHLVTAYQIHSAHAVQVEQPWPRAASPEADAMASRNTNVALGILTADCAPVLFADADAPVGVGPAAASLNPVFRKCWRWGQNRPMFAPPSALASPRRPTR